MKYRKLTAFALALSALGGVAPSALSPALAVSAEDTQAVNKVIDLTVGQSTSATLSGYNETPSWYSDTESVATVDQSGKITAVGVGTAYVYAVFTGSLLKFQVNVTAAASDDEEKTVDLGTITLNSEHPGAKANVSDGAVCSSSDSSVAVIDQQGNITAVGTGECTITIVSGKTTYIAKVVSEYTPADDEIQEVELGSFTLSNTGSSGQVKLNLAEGVSAVWSSTDESVAMVDQNGYVTAHSIGTCDIIALTDTVKYISHLTSTYDPKLAEDGIVIGSVSLDNENPSKKINVSSSVDLNGAEWSSSDESIATVDQSGIATAVSSGECRIYLVVGGVKYVIELTSTYNPDANLKTYEIKGIGSSIQLALESGSSAQWSSADESIATVDQDGKITAAGVGETIITVTSGSSSTRVRIIVTEIIIVYGDANCDSSVSVADSVLILQALSNADKYGLTGSEEGHITTQGWRNADCSGGGDGVTALDALAIQKYTLNMITLPEE